MPAVSWESDDELFSLMRQRLFTAVVGDVLDAHGFSSQFLPPQIHALSDDMVVAGRAMPVLEQDISGEDDAPPFGVMFKALDDLRPNEVYLATGAVNDYALWGELMSSRAMQLGAAGAVLNGYSRDTAGIISLSFPTFSVGRYAQDQRPRGRVVDFRLPVRIAAVEIAPGDIIFGDIDGVLVIPRAAERDVLSAAFEKLTAENKVRDAILGGVSSSDAFRRFGVM